ncbi:MAG: phosphatase PAP2 family protein [bacterium]|nr:phosphatase PAP2 family protein [bacterium]
MDTISNEDLLFIPLLLIWIIFVVIRKTRVVFLLLPIFLFLNNTLNHFIKITVKKERPITSTSYSFPSAHAMNTAMVATYIWYFYRKTIYFTFPLVLLVSYSRIYLKAHYFIDVAAGVVLGVLTGLIFSKFTKLFLKKYI